MDTRGQLVQSARDLRKAADKERISMGEVQKQLDQVKKSVQSAHNHGASAGGGEDIQNQLDRQVKDMLRDIDNLERQAREMDKQARSF